jgi:hypothetical protein
LTSPLRLCLRGARPEGDKDLPNVRLRRETNDSLFPFGFVILTVCGVPFARKVVCTEGLYLPRDELPSDRVEAVMSKETNRNMKLTNVKMI